MTRPKKPWVPRTGGDINYFLMYENSRATPGTPAKITSAGKQQD